MKFKDFLDAFVRYNKMIYKKLIILSILLFYFTFLIYFNYFRIILGYELESSWGFGIIFTFISTAIFVLLIDLLVISWLDEKNVLAGLIITDLIAFVSYIIFPLGIVHIGDIHMIIGSIVGIRFTLKKIKPNQSFFIHGVIVGLGGTILTGVLLTMFNWVVFSGFLNVTPLMVIIIFEFYFIEAIIIGLALGIILGAYYYNKNNKHIESSSKDDEVLENPIDK